MPSHSSFDIFHSSTGEIYPLEWKVIKLPVDYARTTIVFWRNFFRTISWWFLICDRERQPTVRKLNWNSPKLLSWLAWHISSRCFITQWTGVWFLSSINYHEICAIIRQFVTYFKTRHHSRTRINNFEAVIRWKRKNSFIWCDLLPRVTTFNSSPKQISLDLLIRC